MESKTKNKQNIGILQEMVARAFGAAAVPAGEGWITELKDGYFNVTYQITLADGRDTILKIAPPVHAEIMSYEKNIMQTEVTAMRLAKDRTNVPVPEIYSYDNSGDLVEAEYYFMEKLEGIPFASLCGTKEMTLERKTGIEMQIGRYNRELNEIRGTCFGYPGLPERQGDAWDEVFLAIMEDLLRDGEKKQVELGVSYESIRDILQKKRRSLSEVTDPRFLHWDLWAGNVLVSGDMITGIIDFERAVWGDPLMEHYFRTINGDERSRAFLDGYGIAEFTEDELVRMQLYNLHLFIIMAIECFYRQYETLDQYHWAKGKIMESLIKLGYAVPGGCL